MLTYFTSQWDGFEELVISSKFLNSAFVAAMLGAIPGACFGAWAGARAASKFAERSRVKHDLSEELRSISKGILTAFNICNRMIALKRQHVLPMRERFDESRAELMEAIAQNRQGVFQFLADLQTLTPISLPTKALEDIVLEKTSAGGRAFALASTLASSEGDLKHVIVMRNELVERFKKNRAALGFGFERAYFGLPDSDGHVDKTYPDLVEAISMITDDCIYFSKLLGEDLSKHGEKVGNKFKKKFGAEPPKLPQADFEKAEVLGLIPPVTDYTDWESSFLERTPEPSRWQRLYGWAKNRIKIIESL